MIDPHIFSEHSLLTLIRFQDAFNKLAENNWNQNIEVEFSNLSRLEVRNNEGGLTLESNSDLSTMFFTSPISGTFKYYLDVQQKRFYSNKDGHFLDENLSR